MAIPYWALRDAGAAIDLASIKGGRAPADPRSMGEKGARNPGVQRFLDDPAVLRALNDTAAIATAGPAVYSGVFLPGGHDVMWDFAQSAALTRIVGRLFDQGGVVDAICHGSAGLLSVRRADGGPIVSGRRVNAFTDAEERAVALHQMVPYLLETELRGKGVMFEANPKNLVAHAVCDDILVTGQSPASALRVAEPLLEAFAAAGPAHAA